MPGYRIDFMDGATRGYGPVTAEGTMGDGRPFSFYYKRGSWRIEVEGEEYESGKLDGDTLVEAEVRELLTKHLG
jgi:hypothetical protein